MATKKLAKKTAPKRSFKRYAEGGETEEDDKRAGLEASKDDTVGLWERLKAGNIDDPSSEAYKRWGAGRGRAAKAPVKSSGTPDLPVTADTGSDDYEDRIAARSASTYRQSDEDAASSAKAAAKAAPKAKPAGGPGRKPNAPLPSTGAASSRGKSGGPSAKELAEYSKAKNASDNRRALNASESYKRTDYSRPAEEPGLENMSADFIAGPAKLGAAAVGAGLGLLGAKKFMQRGAKEVADKFVRRGAPEIGYESAKRIGMESGKKALPAPPRALPGPRGAAAEVEDVVAKGARDEVTNPLAWMMGPKGVLGKKKGGAIKAKAFAKGGSVSASKRADGIASRGKTRGKIC